MPNNENNDFQNNQTLGFDNNSNNMAHQIQQPIIEIPQTYYEKLEQEKAAEEAALQAQNPAPVQTDDKTVKPFFLFSIITAVITFAILYLTVNVNEIIMVVLPIYIIIFSIIFAIKDKKESSFPISVIVGGMISAVICFVISMLTEDMDLWTYYTTASALTGFIGLAASNIVTKVFTDIKNVKAVQTIIYILFFVILIAGPIIAYKNWPTEFYQIMFYRKKEVVATNYEEFVQKTLKSRYGVSFTCNFNTKKTLTTKDYVLSEKENFKNEKNELMAKLHCVDENNNSTIVTTIAYNEGGTQYTIIDNFMDVLYFNEIKAEISKKIQSVTNASEVLVYLFPKENCTFIGDCVDCEEYFDIYQKETDSKNRYKVSSKIDYTKYINLSNEEFIKKHINTNKYKIIINIRGTFNKNTYDFNQSVQDILKIFNDTGIQNTFGYEIKYNNYSKDNYEIEVHNVVGKKTSTKKFE